MHLPVKHSWKWIHSSSSSITSLHVLSSLKDVWSQENCLVKALTWLRVTKNSLSKHSILNLLGMSAGVMVVQVYVIVFGISIAGVGVWRDCRGTGFHFRAATAGLIAVFGMSFVLQLGLFFGGSRGWFYAFVQIVVRSAYLVSWFLGDLVVSWCTAQTSLHMQLYLQKKQKVQSQQKGPGGEELFTSQNIIKHLLRILWSLRNEAPVFIW